jgi:ferric-dicitrate binding protein FerR (iron transport regulator)
MTTDPKALIHGYLDGVLSDAQFQELNDWIKEDPAHAQEFASIALLHDRLHDQARARAVLHDDQLGSGEQPLWDSCRVRSPWRRPVAALRLRLGRLPWDRSRVAPSSNGQRFRGWRRRSAVAAVVIGIGLAALGFRSQFLGGGGGAVASLVEARDVVWDHGQTPIALNARIPPGEIRCQSGMLKLAFDSGALVALEGPADLRILSGMRIRALRGRITAHVDDRAKGFAIETPNTVVVDQGTEFGVEVDAAGQTGVVVFQGLVDLARRVPSERSTPFKRLSQGEGMRIGRSGSLSRIVAVERRPGDDAWSTGPAADDDAVIRSVHDNIRGPECSKYYQLVRRGLDDDVPAYVDRLHQWNGLDARGLPAFLRGADYIMPFNDDKWTKSLQVTVAVACDATLYVFFDDREKIPPWLSERFTDTGVNIGLDECSGPTGKPLAAGRGPGQSIDHVLSVWKCELGRGESIKLGALLGARQNMTMYGIAAVPRR